MCLVPPGGVGLLLFLFATVFSLRCIVWLALIAIKSNGGGLGKGRGGGAYA